MGSVAIPSGGGGSITDKRFTVLYTRDMDADAWDTKSISIGKDYTEVILAASSSYDNSGVKVNSVSNLTLLYSSRISSYYHTSGYIWVYSKKKGQSASINFSYFGIRVLAR